MTVYILPKTLGSYRNMKKNISEIGNNQSGKKSCSFKKTAFPQILKDAQFTQIYVHSNTINTFKSTGTEVCEI